MGALFECPLRVSTRRDHTIYPIGDWSVRTLWKWWSTASGCSPGLRLGLGLATTPHATNFWFVPPYHQDALQAGLQNPPLQAVQTSDPPYRQGPHSSNQPAKHRVIPKGHSKKRNNKYVRMSPLKPHYKHRDSPKGHSKPNNNCSIPIRILSHVYSTLSHSSTVTLHRLIIHSLHHAFSLYSVYIIHS